ncbi:hypothetical protein [Bacillus phage vB_BanS-Thrax2]|nr:hypothetical protein [Bacillus phage vB_BanS-Thrax2]
MNLNLNLNSDKVFDKSYGDEMSIPSFISCCQCGGFIDYDGYAVEMLLKGKVVWNAREANGEPLYPSDALDHEDELLKLARENKGLKIVWYNR